MKTGERKLPSMLVLALLLVGGAALAAPPPHAQVAPPASTAHPGAHAPSHAAAMQRMSPKQLLAAEREAMAPLARMDGIWRGTAKMTMHGRHIVITQTERIGPFLGGSVKVMEGRGYDADGKVVFNALGIVSYQPRKHAYRMHSYARGYAGDFAFTPTADGFSWTIPMGPTTVRYTDTIKGGTWHEVGDRSMPGKPPVRFFEMTLKRVGDTAWPAAGAVPFKP